MFSAWGHDPHCYIQRRTWKWTWRSVGYVIKLRTITHYLTISNYLDPHLSADAPSGFFPIIRHIYQQHGLGGFYIGLQARLAHVASIITTQLVLYDLIKMALGLPVTGAH
jgi:hypothetical protein